MRTATSAQRIADAAPAATSDRRVVAGESEPEQEQREREADQAHGASSSESAGGGLQHARAAQRTRQDDVGPGRASERLRVGHTVVDEGDAKPAQTLLQPDESIEPRPGRQQPVRHKQAEGSRAKPFARLVAVRRDIRRHVGGPEPIGQGVPSRLVGAQDQHVGCRIFGRWRRAVVGHRSIPDLWRRSVT